MDVNYRQFKETYLSAQKNAARCIGGQDKDVVSLEARRMNKQKEKIGAQSI